MATKKPTPAPKETTPPPAAAPKKGKGLLIAVLAGVALLLAGGGGAWYFLKGSGEAAADTAHGDKKAPKKAPLFVTLEPFTVNLRDDEGAHYLQVAVVLSVTDAGVGDAIKVHMPMIRNGILLLLSSKRSDELASLDGKQKLATEIATEARKPLAAAGVTEGVESVYFSSFVIQ